MQQGSAPAASSPLASLSPVRKNHNWTAAETEQLVDILYKNVKYQIALLPGRITREQERGQKISKTTLFRQMSREIFGENEPGHVMRIKSKIVTLSRIYNTEKKKLGETGSGLLWKDVQVGTEVRLSLCRSDTRKWLTPAGHPCTHRCTTSAKTS
jgi:hypothetical protein